MWFQIIFLSFLLRDLSWTVFANADPCPELYRRYSAAHTYCLPPNSECNIVKNSVSPESIRIILKEHNRYRSNLAMGQEQMVQLPKAADMIQMEWDDELAAVAQKHADQCLFEHDCNECRQTKDFSAGQNLYMRYISGSVPRPTWRAAIKAWYDEIANFDRSLISPFDMSRASGVIGHFTQVVWSKSWKVGCGYTIYKEGDNYKELYTCNYGPAGNMMEDAMYEIGEPCSACPINSCCDNTCSQPEYPGLCKIIDAENNGPLYQKKNQENVIFFCNFRQETACPVEIPNFMKRWDIFNTLSGPYIGVVLEGGQRTSLKIAKLFLSDDASCLSINYRKGPNVDGQETASTATEQFTTSSGSHFQIPLNTDSASFYKFSMNMNFVNVGFTVSITFEVPEGKAAQYFELQDVTFTRGSC